MDSANGPLLIFWREFGNWGFMLVLAGVIGEVLAAAVESILEKCKISNLEKWKSRLKRYELIAGWILIIGLAMEFKGHQRETNILDADNAVLYDDAKQAGKDAAAAYKIAGLANERTANTESNNLVLRSNVAALELQVPENSPINSISALVYFNGGRGMEAAVADLKIFLKPTESYPHVSFSAGQTNAHNIWLVVGTARYDFSFPALQWSNPLLGSYPSGLGRPSARQISDLIGTVSLHVSNFGANGGKGYSSNVGCTIEISINGIVMNTMKLLGHVVSGEGTLTNSP